MDKKRSLHEAAPGLHSSLVKILSPEELSIVAKTYEVVEREGGGVELPIIREVDASFNPRPARIATIVLVDGKPTELFKTINLSFWSCLLTHGVGAKLKSLVPDDLFDPLARIGSGVLTSNENINEVIVAFAIQLDRVRHLHMTNLSNADKSALLLEVENWVASVRLHTPELPILKKVAHAINQQKRILEGR